MTTTISSDPTHFQIPSDANLPLPFWTLHTDGKGRQWWQPQAVADAARLYGIPETVLQQIMADIQAARDDYQTNRYTVKHSSDRVMRVLAKYKFMLPEQVKQEPKRVHNKVTYKELAAEFIRDTDDEVVKTIKKAITFESTLQASDGHWPSDYAGPMFLLPGLIITLYITGNMPTVYHQYEIRRYLMNHQAEDGGWPLHIQGNSTMFGTALNYVAFRMCGGDPNSDIARRATAWIKQNGGVQSIPSWGKFWLAVANLYDWRGLNPLPAETWLLPYSVLIHPARMWCHCRVVYLPMSFMYCGKFQAKLDPLLTQLRSELYQLVPFNQVDWPNQRYNCCPIDRYFNRPWIQNLVWDTFYKYEWASYVPGRDSLKKKAMAETIDHIMSEDLNTNFICIGPVNKALNMLACWFHDPDSPHFKNHIDRVKDYLWLAEDGLKMQGYNGSQLWDASFMIQGITSAGTDISNTFIDILHKAYHYFDVTQVQVNVPNREKYYRHQSKGAWPFSTVDHGWPISDCTSEGLKGVLCVQNLQPPCPKVKNPIPTRRLEDAIDMMISYQNKDGGWATYENNRAPTLLELFNPSEVFGDIMVDFSYVECSSACLTALMTYRKQSNYRIDDVNKSVERGITFIKSIQKQDGSWYGSWGVCFTYGIWFGVEALVAYGENAHNSSCVRKACEFLVSKQKADGSWGESYLSCQDKVYSEAEVGQIVNTAWAVISLCKAKWDDTAVITNAVKFLIQMQDQDGDWPQQLISGVFNRNCMITYGKYRASFPLWALGEYRHYMKQRNLVIFDVI